MLLALFYVVNLLSLIPKCWTLGFDEAYVGWNLNQNPNTQQPLEYSGAWADHVYFPSPKNWRFPFYVITLDRQAW